MIKPKKIRCMDCHCLNMPNASYCWLCKGTNLLPMQDEPDMAVPQLAADKPKPPSVFQADVPVVSGREYSTDPEKEGPQPAKPESSGIGSFLLFLCLIGLFVNALNVPLGLMFSNYALFGLAGSAVVALICSDGRPDQFFKFYFTMVVILVVICRFLVNSLMVAFYMICSPFLH